MVSHKKMDILLDHKCPFCTFLTPQTFLCHTCLHILTLSWILVPFYKTLITITAWKNNNASHKNMPNLWNKLLHYWKMNQWGGGWTFGFPKVRCTQTTNTSLWLTHWWKLVFFIYIYILYIFIKMESVNLTNREAVLPLCQLIWSKIIQYLVSPSISFKLCKMWFSTCELVILFNLLWIAPALPAL